MQENQTWRAMVIKDNIGDWAIVSADWVGMKKGISAGRYSVKGDPGHFVCKVRFLRHPKRNGLGPVTEVFIIKDIRRPINIGFLSGNMSTGTIVIMDGETEPRHQAALFFTISTTRLTSFFLLHLNLLLLLSLLPLLLILVYYRTSYQGGIWEVA